jgi:acyl-CoA reductase-like NAD-dependent aldehyde dehydrogenase
LVTRSTPHPRWARWSPSARWTGSLATVDPGHLPAARAIEKGKAEGATLAAGGGRPKDLEKGYYVEPTVFGNVSNSSAIAQEEIFGPVLSVIPADNEAQASQIANDTIYGLNSSVFTNDVDKAREPARQLRAGTVGHNAFRTDFGIAFGGFKQSGIGREGGIEGLLPFLETKTVILDGPPGRYR